MMTKEQAAAYVHAQSVAAQCEIEAMKAANHERDRNGCALAYPEEAFRAVIDEFGISHNAIFALYAEAA